MMHLKPLLKHVFVIFAECDMGYYGIGCLQECSSFCKTSRDCHHVTGYCKDGCKSGWQGNDCLEGNVLFRRLAIITVAFFSACYIYI